MPHKRNPVLATLVLSAALQVPAQAAVLAQCMLAPDVTAQLSGDELDALLDPVEYLGVAGHLVDRALSRRGRAPSA